MSKPHTMTVLASLHNQDISHMQYNYDRRSLSLALKKKEKKKKDFIDTIKATARRFQWPGGSCNEHFVCVCVCAIRDP